ncbi:hypothetical protein HYC85_029453 [Camellia sinensis]|uniref:Uncharacterized protein n=1 Tax=Camellia sinensis TaxID=4442 RepID=A0A7J7FY26_CAMSI|nr:hypothetical protein HYC85_029453 [Camellia sinensis]
MRHALSISDGQTNPGQRSNMPKQRLKYVKIKAYNTRRTCSFDGSLTMHKDTTLKSSQGMKEVRT